MASPLSARSGASASTSRSWVTRSCAGAYSSRTSRSGRSRATHGSRRRGRGRGRGGDGEEYRWDRVVADNEAAVQEVVAAIKAGKPVSRLTWKKFDIIKRRARVPRKAGPGPGAYLKQKHTSSFGKQVLTGRASAGVAHMGTKHPVKSVFTMPVSDSTARRVKVLPSDVKYGRGRPSSPQAEVAANKARRAKKWRKKRDEQLLHSQTKTVTSQRAKKTLLAIAKTYEDLPTTLGSNVTSKYASAPSFSVASRTENPALKMVVDTPGPTLNPSSLGPQILSQYPSGGTVVFSSAGRYNSRIQDDYVSSLPGPTSYHPKLFAGAPRAPAYSLARSAAQDFNPFRTSDVGPGSYDPVPSLGKQVSSSLRSAPAHRFGPAGEGIKDLDLHAVKFDQAHERHQPLGVRDVFTRTFTNRADSTMPGQLKPLHRSRTAAATLGGSRRS